MHYNECIVRLFAIGFMHFDIGVCVCVFLGMQKAKAREKIYGFMH